MKPVSPVIPGSIYEEVVIAKNQPQYIPLPAIYDTTHGVVLTRWKASFVERLRVLLTGNVYLRVRTFNKPLQPLRVMTVPEDK